MACKTNPKDIFGPKKPVQKKAMGGIIKHLGKMTEKDRIALLFKMDQEAQAKPVKR
jgi:hypothetical protein